MQFIKKSKMINYIYMYDVYITPYMCPICNYNAFS
jgi:hypothetical protein